MSTILFKQNKNQADKVLNELMIGVYKFPLSDKEVMSLLIMIKEERPDLFEVIDGSLGYKDKIDELNNCIDEQEETINMLKEELDTYEDN